MRTWLFPLLVVLLAGCGSPAPVRTAPPASTDRSPAPSAPGEIPDLRELLFSPGDLSSNYRPESGSSSLPKELSDLPGGIQVAGQTFLNVVYTSEITLIVYETTADTNTAYLKSIELIQKIYAETLSSWKYKTETTAEVGDQASLIALEKSTLGNVSLVYSKCNALVYIHLLANDATKQAAITYGQNVEKRVEPLVCH